MTSILKRVALGLAGLVALVLIVAVGAGAWLAFPTKPKSTATLTFAGFIPLPQSGAGPLHILDYLTIDGGALYVTNESSGAVDVVPAGPGALPAGRQVRVSAGEGAAHGVLLDPTSKLGFVTRSEANVVDVVDFSAGKVVKHIPADEDVDGIFYDSTHRLIATANGDAKVLDVIDPATQTKLASIPLGGKPEYAVFDAQAGLLYQNLSDTNQVAAVDLVKRTVVARWPLGACQGPTSLAMDVAGHRLFATCGTNALLAVMNLDTHQVIATLPIGGGPDSVAYDAALHRLYATGKSGVMTVIQQDDAEHYRVADTLKLHYGAHTLVVDPATHRLYVGYASFLTAPRLAVFDPPK